MRLYHGSLEVVEQPRILFSDPLGDFGSGFYTTSDLSQARRFVVTKCPREKCSGGFVSIYEAPDDLLSNGYGRNIKAFQQADAQRTQFVLANRKQRDFEHDYDIVAGAVANDQVYASFALYENEIIDLDELLERLKIRKLTDQILFHSERALGLLKFIGREEVVCQPKYPKRMSGCFCLGKMRRSQP